MEKMVMSIKIPQYQLQNQLQKQDKEYLKKIIEQNELIIKQNEELLRRK